MRTSPLAACAKLVFGLVLCLSTADAATGAGGTTGAVVPMPPPASLLRNTFESNTTIALIEERRNLVLPAAVTLDSDGTPRLYNDLTDLTGGTLSAGEIVDIHILHFDPVEVVQAPIRVSGSVTFDRPIVGMALRRVTLDTSDQYGAPGTIYPTNVDSSFREFEFGGGASGVSDTAEISPDRLTLSLDWGATLYLDQLRVFTAVPEPGPRAMWTALALAGVAHGAIRARQRHAVSAKLPLL